MKAVIMAIIIAVGSVGTQMASEIDTKSAVSSVTVETEDELTEQQQQELKDQIISDIQDLKE